MPGANLGSFVRELAPALFAEVDPIVAEWLAELLAKLEGDDVGAFRPKQVNDPIWGTIELAPWEVALLDTPMLQRLRGVRQLGLANLVFPGASHSRLEHIIGVLGAVDQMVSAISKQIDRWNREHPVHKRLQPIEDRDRYTLRVAALFHDVGHGPFSHASEPLLDIDSSLMNKEGNGWRQEIKSLKREFKAMFSLHDEPASSEVLAIAILYSVAVEKAFKNQKLFGDALGPSDELRDRIALSIIGAIDGPVPSPHLSAIISSQIDADRMDFLSRDAHHAGLEIGFDTKRLLARLEILRITEQYLDDSEIDLRKKVAESPEGVLYQIGIAASGFGSFEQMLIGRTFLYDRLYHHHKIRAAEAMAQRLMLALERDRDARLSLAEILMPLGDESVLQIYSGEVAHSKFQVPDAPSRTLAKGILRRNLLHRAFAFRARFIAAPPGMDSDTIEQNQSRLWNELLKTLKTLSGRFVAGKEIYELAANCIEPLRKKGLLTEACDKLPEYTADHIIIDFPGRKAEPIRLLARYPNGQLRVPEFSFNPAKWADAYDLQKRTGYVFAPKQLVPLITVASKIFFLRSFGIAMAKDADGFIKKGLEIDEKVLEAIRDAELIDDNLFEHLTNQRFSLVKIRAADLNVPDSWLGLDPDFALKLALSINEHIEAGLTFRDLQALGRVLKAVFAFVDSWHSGSRVTGELANEKELQATVKEALSLQGLKVVEGAEVNGGELDLWVEDSVLIENKFEGSVVEPARAAPDAGMQARRYTIALNSKMIIVILAYRAKPGAMRSKTASVEVRRVIGESDGRVQIRIYLPYGAVPPSREKAK